MLLLSVLLVVNYQQEPHLKVLYMQSPVDHRTLELLYPYDGWLAVLRIVDFTGRHVVHSALWQIKVKLTKYVVNVFNRGEHTLCNDTSWKTVIWIWAEIQLVVNCNLGIKTWGKPCMFLSHEFLIVNITLNTFARQAAYEKWIPYTIRFPLRITIFYFTIFSMSLPLSNVQWLQLFTFQCTKIKRKLYTDCSIRCSYKLVILMMYLGIWLYLC